ncbi:transposase [Erysipelothrix larvae]
MYEPYMQLNTSCFHKAEIITDRFHIVQHLNRALNSTRISVMNDEPNSKTKFKTYWKLILKDNLKLDNNNSNYYRCYRHLMNESMVVDDLLRVDKILEETYWVHQRLTQAIRNKNITTLLEILNDPPKNISKQMKKAINTLTKYEVSVSNALKYPYSNGRLEGTNNLIKVIKRIAFGYRSFENFRTRVLLICNTMVRLEIKSTH